MARGAPSLPRRLSRASLVAALALAAVTGASPERPAEALVWPDVPERVERALRSPDPSTRRAAAQELHTLSRARGAPLVLQALGDGDVEVKLAAAQSAIRLRVAAATEAVLPWLGDREARLRLAACDVLRALPSPRAIPQLARALGDADAGVRAAAADALGAQASADAVPPLLGKLDDASPPVRIQIVRALARLGDARAVVPLIGKVQDSVVDVRQAVVRALGDLGDARAAQALALSLRDNTPDVRLEALRALGRLRAPEATDTIVPSTLERNPALRQAALAALGRIGTREAVRGLVAALGVAEDATGGFESTPVREALVRAGAAAIPELVAVLEGSPTPAVATSAAWVLGALAATREAKVVVAAMRRGVLPTAAALHALAGMKAVDAIPVVLEFVGSSSPTIRAEAAQAAHALLDPAHPDGRAVEPLAAALRGAHATPDERATLASLLGRTGAPRAAPVLVGLSDAKVLSVKLAAIEALGTLGPAGADDPLLAKLDDASPEVRLRAAIALGDAGGARARDALLAKLDTGEEVDRGAALTALGGVLARVPTEPAVQRLSRALELGAGSERDALLIAIGRARLPAAERVLEGAARGDDVDDRRTAASLLPGHPRAPPILRRLRADPDASVRAAAGKRLPAARSTRSPSEPSPIARDGDLDAAIDATAAIGRITARGAAQEAPRLLCPLLSDGRAYVRVNALAGLTAAKVRCADGAVERALLSDDPNLLVRSAAAASLGRSPSPVDAAALERCAVADRAGSVARRCERATAAPRAPESAPPPHALEVYVVPDGSGAPRPRAAYALAFADGFVRVGLADRRGALFEPAAPDGLVALEPPGAQAR